MQRNLRFRDAPVLVRVLVGRNAAQAMVNLLLESHSGSLVLHIRRIVELSMFRFEGRTA
jgi:hypothetical protein